MPKKNHNEPEPKHHIAVKLEVEVDPAFQAATPRKTVKKVREAINNRQPFRVKHDVKAPPQGEVSGTNDVTVTFDAHPTRVGTILESDVSKATERKSYTRYAWWKKLGVVLLYLGAVGVITFVISQLPIDHRILTWIAAAVTIIVLVIDAWKSWVATSTIALLIASCSLAISIVTSS